VARKKLSTFSFRLNESGSGGQLTMNFQPASATSVAAFLAIVTAVIAAFLGAVGHAVWNDPRRTRLLLTTILVLGAWLGGLTAAVVTGALLRLPLAGLPVFFSAVLLVSVATGLSPLGRRLATTVPIAALVGFHAFRLPLELVLHSWGEQGTIPMSMTWRGQNWDIITGFVALVAMPFAERHRGIAWVANVIGFALLLNVMRVALMSAPLPFGWGVTPPLLVALNFPYMLIGPVCVGGALVGHIVLTRALLRRTAHPV
jgi:hypothetical protein